MIDAARSWCSPEADPPARGITCARVVRFLLAQVLVMIGAFGVLRIELPAPPEQYRIDHAAFRRIDPAAQTGPEHVVRLPDNWGVRREPKGKGVYRIGFDAPAESGGPCALMVLYYSDDIEVTFNGVPVPKASQRPVQRSASHLTPELFPLSPAAMRPGRNELEIELNSVTVLSGYLGGVYVGPVEAITPIYTLRDALQTWTHVGLFAWEALLLLVIAILWWARPQEIAYGPLAGLLLFGLLHAATRYQSMVPWLVGVRPLGNLTVIWETSLGFMFTARFVGLKLPFAGRWLLLPAAVVSAIVLFGPQPIVALVTRYVFVPVVIGGIFGATVVAARAYLTRGLPGALPISLAASILVVFGMHGVLVYLGVLPEGRIVYVRPAVSLFVAATTVLVTWRFARVLDATDRFADHLAQRIRETEQALHESFARERVQAEQGALARERARVVRDLHDGLGGHLVSIGALAARRPLDAAAITATARAALDDMRNVVDTLDDVDGDLGLFLGTWKERLEATLRAHDIRLDWRVTAMPTVEGLRPVQLLEIRRILQEATTNVIKHAGSPVMRVEIDGYDWPDGSHGAEIRFTDEGTGRAASSGAGRGIDNMRQRASALGGELVITSGGGGTTVALRLPRRIADGGP